ncbi:efflux RND transporter periplasmic adaptor subunit [Patiriisocius marinus]|uniref:efflux RND transporter periplasmic adaptor subunit n=1 Tax=Patiriisocius marinus TaxID=1397112 RepID=UPI00232B83D5|nr:efflux RND transporter periplasmic adaptor subunit [Patiriisocius marinus]
MKRNIYKIVTLTVIVLLWSCGETNNKIDTNDTDNLTVDDGLIKVTQTQFEQNEMKLGKLEEKAFPKIISVNGMIDVPPENRAVVSATMGGYIKTTPLLVGDVVKKGQVLVTIENPQFVSLQQEYMEVNEQLMYLKSEYDRQTTMKAENITSQKSYLKAESDYKTAVAKHTGLDKQLRMLNISPSRVREGLISSIVSMYAPISGSITKINITKGSYVSPATEILEIIDTDHIHLELSVFEKDILNIKKGQKIDFKISEASSEIYKAEVHLVGTSIQPDRKIAVHGHIENEDETNFLTGMFVDANIITETTVSKALPSEAIVEVDNISYILILNKKEDNSYYFSQEEISTKVSYNGFSIIEKAPNLTPTSQFLTKGAFNLIGE